MYTITLTRDQIDRLIEQLPVRDFADVLIQLIHIRPGARVVSDDEYVPALLRPQAG